MARFQNKVVIVTGASSGIGEATAVDFAKRGAKLVITGRNKKRLGNVAKRCTDAGAQVHEFTGDLGEFKNLKVLIDETVEKFGGIDILVNNAGFGYVRTVDQLDVEMYDKVFNTNVRAPVFLCKYALPHLKKSKGCVVNVSSCAGLKVAATSIAYSMTKAALDHFARGFSAECAPFGVRVNNINPAVVLTRFAENLDIPKEMLEKGMEMYKKAQPLGFISSEQISEGILFLCTSEMTTGVTLPIDGGLLHSSSMS